MLTSLRKFNGKRIPPASIPFALLGLCLLSYALLVPTLGFYWDDFPFAWIAEKMGAAGLERYFSTNRPFWGLLFQVTTPILGSEPLRWQFFAIFWRWLAGCALWLLLYLTWPRTPKLAAWSSMFFIVYPGFNQQYISLVYSHFFIILTAFFTSFICTLLALRRPRLFLPLTVLGLLLSAVNLLSMEYFFLLEVLRPILVWIAWRDEIPGWRARAKRTFRIWLPYLLLFLILGGWRAFFFQFQTENYQPLLLENFRIDPMNALLDLAKLVFGSLWTVLASAWARPFNFSTITELGSRSVLVYAFILLLTGFLAAVYLLRFKQEEEAGHRLPALQAVLVGLLASFIAGWPFWIIDIGPSVHFPSDRFSLPFIMGTSLFLAGLIAVLPLGKWGRPLILATIIAFSAGYQFQTANAYRQDWEFQQRFFWQMSWRIPQLQPGTTIITNDLPLQYYSDNSLSAPLNWIYDQESAGDGMAYMLFYPSARLGSKLPALIKGEPINVNYLAADFTGSTSQIVAVFYDPPACLRVLDRRLDADNLMISPLMRYAATLSSTSPILLAEGSAQLPPNLYGAEPEHTWCYYFEKADLARQAGDWEQVASLGDQAYATGDYPNDPSERIPFIEGYAHTGNWQRAAELTGEAQAITPAMEPVLCHLWNRINESTPPGLEKEAAILSISVNLDCTR